MKAIALTALFTLTAATQSASAFLPTPVPTPTVPSVLSRPVSKPAVQNLSLGEALMLSQVAYAYVDMGKFETALELYSKILPTIVQNLGTKSYAYLDAMSQITVCYVHLERLQLADQTADRCLELLRQEPKGLLPIDAFIVYNNIAYTKYRVKKYDQAKALYLKILSRFTCKSSLDRVTYAMTETNLADVLSVMHENQQAISRYKHALKTIQREVMSDEAFVTDIKDKIRKLEQAK